MVIKIVYFIYFLIFVIGLSFFSIIWGSVIGIIGKTVANYEDFSSLILQEYWQWKRFPKYSYDKYIKSIFYPVLFSSASRKMDYWDIINCEQNIRLENRSVPSPIIRIPVIFIISIIILPLRWIVGIIDGSLKVFEAGLIFFKNNLQGKKVKDTIFGISEEQKFDKYEEKIEDCKNNKFEDESFFLYL
ncbi:MAG: hypothetical protein WC860_03625 [Candidatus Margulisiibacteriota bacterium]|jgi:hypothetical protein